MATTAAKARVTNRNRLIRLADVGLAIIVLSIPLQFWDDFTSFMLACLGSCVTGFGVSKHARLSTPPTYPLSNSTSTCCNFI